jgi:O-antigen/teichoic acid export membrane protein
MFHQLKALGKSSVGFLAITLINSLISFASIPALTRILTPEDFGYLTLFAAYSGVLSGVITLSALTLYAKQYYTPRAMRSEYLFTSFVMILSIATMAAIITSLLAGQYLESLVGIKTNYQVLAFFSIFMDEVVAALLLICRFKNNMVVYAIFEIAKNTSRIALISICSLWLNISGADFIYVVVLNSAFYSVIALILLFKNRDLELHWSLPKFFEIIYFGFPLAPHVIGGALSTAIDKFLIAKMLSTRDVGIYAVAFSFGGIIKLIESSINSAFQPWLFEKLIQAEMNKSIIVKATITIIMTLATCSLLLILIISIAKSYIVGDQFLDVLAYIPWISAAFVINALYSTVNQILIFKNKTITVSVITITCIFVGVIVSVMLIHLNGSIGAAQGLFATLSIRALIALVFSQKQLPLPWVTFYQK